MKKLIFVLSLLLVLLMVSCTAGETPLPAPKQPTTEAQAVEAERTPAAEVPTAAPEEPLPPLVLRSSPELGEELPLDGVIELTFDQPMDRDSVEKAFAIEPGASVDGAFEWTDDRTVRFAFKDGFKRDERYKVRVIESAKSQAGVEMSRPFELRFSTAGYLEVANVLPADGASEVLPDTVVTVLFNRPVVPLNAIEDAASLPDPLTFVPPVTGRGEWLNTSIYQFTPDEGFESSTEYTARLGQGLSDALGQATLEDDYEWTFTTVTPAAIASIPAAGDIYVSPTPVISVTFNQPMDRDSVEQNFILRNENTGEVVSGQFEWVAGGLRQPGGDEFEGYYEYEYAEGEGPTEVGVETVMFTPDTTLDFDGVYAIVLPKGAHGKIGQAETQSDFTATFTVTPYPAIASSYPADGDEQIEPWQSLQITFNAPVNPNSVVIGRNLVIEPSVAVTQVYTYWWSSNTEVEISFPTEASSRYKVTLGADIEGRYGHKLGAPASITWQTRAESPLLYMHSAGRIATYNAYTDTLAFLTVRNLSRVSFELHRLPTADFIRLNGGDWWSAWDAYHPKSDTLINSWELQTSPELDDNVIYRIDLGQRSGLGERLPPGLYYLEASASADDIYPEAKGAELYLPLERKMLVVSNNNVTFKTSNGEGLAWVTDLRSGQPRPDLPITYKASPSGQSKVDDLGQAATGDDGVALLKYDSPRRDAYEPRFAFVGNPDQPDENFGVTVSDWAEGIDRWQYDNVSVEDYQQPYNALFYTDRNIYRPGQTVYFKGILRADDDANYSLPTASDTVNLMISDSQGKEIYNDDLPISEMGTVHGSFDLDENAALGYYSIQITYDEIYYFYDDFQVAAYRKPEFLVEASTDQPEYTQGDKIRVTASAEFFSGGPVSNAAVRWTLLSDDYFFRYQGRGFYDFTDYDFSRQSLNNYYPGFGESIAEGEGVTDGEGRFTFEVEADIAEKIASQRYTFDIVITDINNQEVAAQAGAIVHKGLVYIGLRPEKYVGQVGRESQVNVLAVDWDSEPVARQEVELVFAEHNWYSVQKQYEDGSFYWDSVVEDIPVFTTTVATDADGRAVAAFTPEQGGIYKVAAAAVDAKGNEVRSSTFMWVSGVEYVNWRQENNDRIDLVADQREYRVGDTATVLIPHPYSGTVQALVTLERGHIYDHYVTELKTNSEQIEIPIEEWMIPNMYVSVVVIKGVDEANALPSFKVGYASLPINTAEKQLDITLTPNKPAGETYQPGDTVEYQVRVTDAQSQPVKAELSLALVDKAVLSLAPETPGQLLDTFWRNRGLGVKTAGGLTLAIDRINLTVAPEAKGGGGGFDEGFGVIRGVFKDTALWLPDFTTGADGQGTVEAELPDNLTTWTLTGKGVTAADTLVGESTVEIVSTKPLLVRPVAPRFFVVGDEAQMGMIVQNNTQEVQEVETRFEAEGLTIEPLGEQAGAPFEIAAGERVKVEYKVTVEDVPTAKLTMGAKSSNATYGDALTFDLPVYKFSTPETVATVGVLAEDGSRAEGIALPRSFDPTQGDLTVNIDPSLAAGMRDGLDYLEHFPYECTEQTVSRFLPNVFTYRAYQQLGMDRNATPNAAKLAEKLPGLVSVGLQRLYGQQHFDGGWGWWILDDSDPFLTAYVLLGLVEAKRADFAVDEQVIQNAVDYLEASLIAPKDVAASWQANRQAFILYVLAEAGQGDLGRSVALFKERQKMDLFGRAYLALAIHLLDEQADQVDTLLGDITSGAIVSATGAHWEEAQVDYYSMNTDTRSTAIIMAALARIQPDNPILPNAVRWLMSIRENGGHWETTQETVWAIIGLTDWMVATGELEGNYAWQVSLNGESLGEGAVDQNNIDETTRLRVEVGDLLADAVNRLAVERDPIGGDVSGSPGRLYYAAYLTYYKPVQEVKALERGIIVSRQYRLATPTQLSPSEGEGQEEGPITQAKVGDTIEVRLTLIAPNDLHYVVVEDPFPAGTEGIDTSLATTSVVGQAPELERTDRTNPWGRGYGWWYFSHAELRDEKAVLFATFLPKGTYEYTYQVRASLPGEYRVIPTHAEEMYFPEVFGRGDGGLFRVTE
ncbi:MAG: Ig-like domain-containing protein [Chloroflexota bacterium]